MTPNGPIRSETYRLFMDYGQFYLFGGGEGDPELVEKAIEDGSIANDGRNIVVLSPHQNNFDMKIKVELWGDRQDADRDQWQFVSDQTIRISDSGILNISSVGTKEIGFPLSPGTYHVEISGRGFKNVGWPGNTKPGDAWRVRLWADSPEGNSATLPDTKRWP